MKPSCVRTIFLILMMFTVPLAVTAQDPPEVEIDHPPTDVADDLRPDPGGTAVDTAIVFTNVRSAKTVVRCRGYDHNGILIGRTITRIPARGLRFIRASDLSGGLDFLGHVRCSSSVAVAVSAVVVAPGGLTDVPVKHVVLNGINRYRVSVVTSF